MRHQAREFETMKNKIITKNSLITDDIEQNNIDEDDIINEEIMDYYRSNPNPNLHGDNNDNYDIDEDCDISVNSDEEQI
jgi:hypothetical protein